MDSTAGSMELVFVFIFDIKVIEQQYGLRHSQVLRALCVDFPGLAHSVLRLERKGVGYLFEVRRKQK